MLTVTDPKTANIRFQSAFYDYKSALEDSKRMFLRRSFDCANIDTCAKAVITLTIEEGFLDLANEMKADFKSETGKEAIEC